MSVERESASESGRSRAGAKSATAFRTISEVSEELEVPQHVLRFWETKFTQVRPLKRGGGRRYYRPEDVALLRRIQRLLYAEGYTIKGVQRLLRDPRATIADGDEDETQVAEGILSGPEPDEGEVVGVEENGASHSDDAVGDDSGAENADTSGAEPGESEDDPVEDGDEEEEPPPNPESLRTLSRFAAAVARAEPPQTDAAPSDGDGAGVIAEAEDEYLDGDSDPVILPSPFSAKSAASRLPLAQTAAEPLVIPGWVRQRLIEIRDDLKQIRDDFQRMKR